ncbi:MAG TPA: hypothetical protein VM492_09040, partial [Sumerlaeia bacterium]|nr:hypothetical protein [Sumerlaeia bacterium]
YGRGMTLVCGISGAWPWRFQTPSDNASYSAFWKEMMLIVRQETDARLQVKAAPAIATAGSEVSVEGTVLDQSFQPDPATPAALEIQTPDGETVTVQAPSPPGGEESREITFRHRLTPAAAGTYKVTARATWKKTGETLERKTMFIVKRDAPELREVRLNEPLLREIASVTGGEYVHLSEYGKLPGLIKPREGSIRKIKEEPIWDRLGVLLAIVGALLTEWLVRRAGSLA